MTTIQVTRDQLITDHGGVWDYVSPSRLSLWLKCPLAFRLKYVERIKTRTTPSLFIGRMVHRALERWYRGRQAGKGLNSRQVLEWLIAEWEPSREAEAVSFVSSAAAIDARAQTVALVQAYLAQLPAAEPHPLAVESAMSAPLVNPESGENLGIPLVGVVDLVLDAPGGALIADFKTAARGGELNEMTHEIQLTCYSHLCRQRFGRPESALEIRNLIKTKVPRVEYHSFRPRSGRHFRRLFAVVRAYLDDLDRGRFVFRPGLGCHFCDFVTRCREWEG